MKKSTFKINGPIILSFILSVLFFSTEKAALCRDDLVWIKDHDGDTGMIPSVAWPPAFPELDEFWNSPDIRTFPEYPRTGTPCSVFATVRNKTASIVTDIQVVFLFDDLCTASSFPSSHADTIEIVNLPVLPPMGEEEVSVQWTPPAEGNFNGDPLWTLGVILNVVGDLQESNWALWDNNVAVKSAGASIQPPGGDPERSNTVFLAGNPFSFPDTVMLSVDRRQVPDGWDVSIDFPENEKFLIQPETLFPIVLTVIPDHEISDSNSAVILVEQFLASSPFRGLEIGMGMTEAVKVSGTTIDLEKAGNGELTYTLDITNHSESPRIIDYWVWAETPDGSLYPSTPLIMAEDTLLPGNWSGTRSISHSIPTGAPTGLYSYVAIAGAWPDTIFDWDYFNFDVE